MAEEKLTLTAEIKDELSAPLDRIQKKVADTSRQIQRSNARSAQSAVDGLRRIGRAMSGQVLAGMNGVRVITAQTATVVQQRFAGMFGRIGVFATNGANRIINQLGRIPAAVNRALATVNANAGVQRIVNAYRSLEPQLQEIARRAMQSMGATMAVAGGAAGLGVATVFTRAITSGLDRAKVIQDAVASGEVLLGSKEAAEGLIKDLTEVVTGTPYNLPDFAKAGTDLIAFGIEAEKVPDIMRAIGEASASRGAMAPEVARNMAINFGQMAAIGRVTMDDIWSMSQAGVDAMTILGNHFGKSGAAMQEMISSGAVPAEEAIEVLTKGIMEGSRGVAGETKAMEGTMEALRKTVSGSWGAMQASIAKMGASFFTPLMDQLPSVFNAMGNVFGGIGEQLLLPLGMAIRQSEIIERIAARIQAAADWIKQPVGGGGLLDFLATHGPALGIASGALAAWGATAASNLPFIGKLFGALNMPLALFLGLMASSPALQEAVGNALVTVSEALLGMLIAAEPLLPPLSMLLSLVAEIAAGILNFLAPSFHWLIPLLLGGALALKGYFLFLGMGMKVAGGVASALKLIIPGAKGAAAAVRLLSFAIRAIPVIGWIITAVMALASAFSWAYENVGWFRDGVDGLVGFFRDFAEGAVKDLQPLLDVIGEIVAFIRGDQNLGETAAKIGAIGAQGPEGHGQVENGRVKLPGAEYKLGFATGTGRVPGSGFGDTVPAMLTPGEAVLVPELARAIGPANIERANYEARHGGSASMVRPVDGAAMERPTGGTTTIERTMRVEDGAVRLSFSGQANYREVKRAVKDALDDLQDREERQY